MKVTVVIIYIFLLFAAKSYAKEVIMLGVENSWPPYSDSDGNGISKDIITKAFRAVELEVEFVVLPYARALKMTKDGILDGAFNVTKQISTIKQFNFHDVPFLKASASFYYPPNSSLDYQRLADIPDDIIIGLIIGYEYGDDYEKHRQRFNEVRLAKQSQIIEMLQSKRIDMAIMFDEVAAYSLQQLNLSSSVIKQGAINHISDIYIAFSKSRDTDNIIKAFESGLKKLNNEAVY
ncbi:amino acid ABC transporter substrate-binding protein [Colwellia sp. M166]|uniref:substrate-binding periplasmic protein n=1 Tax=Colwellia sp. M166 TaxID=2583805 RepID=UPI00211E4454|nr:transporter substrate-binding domain-containing protein [Colwellia sp. M166]UUO24816.1 amino acid ABC transporter substrate-binding protein [Colwellia sp. M166]|tara:strand:- start:30636 stop:31340 length:705 start_codon:yes stop_codon:yes gene_type:complete